MVVVLDFVFCWQATVQWNNRNLSFNWLETLIVIYDFLREKNKSDDIYANDAEQIQAMIKKRLMTVWGREMLMKMTIEFLLVSPEKRPANNNNKTCC